jgi:hypothetical protein
MAILHVKCAVADGRWLILSSANLVTVGSLPSRIDAHFRTIIEAGTLAPCD